MKNEKHLEFQLLEQQLAQLNQNLQNLEKQKAEISQTVNNLESFKDAKVGKKILVPVSNGIFAEAELKNNSKLKVNVGAGIVVEKNIEETKKLMEEQVSQLNKYLDETINYQQQIYIRLHELEQELKKE